MGYTILPAPGTISIDHDSATVTGTGTIFTAYRRGYLLLVPGSGIIGQLAADPENDYEATLVDVLGGDSDIADAAYQVISLTDAAAHAERLRQLVDLLNNNALGIPLIFDATTDAADPGAGRFRFDDPDDPAAAYISKTSAAGGGISILIGALDDVANAAARSIVSLWPLDGANVYADLRVTGPVVDHGTWATVPISLLSGNVPANRARIAMSAVPSGADGTFSGTEVVETSGWTFAAADRGKTFIANSGSALTAAFAAASTLGSTWMVVVKNIGAGTLTLDPNGSETIDGATTLALRTGESAVISCNGSALRTQLRSFGNTAAASRTNMGAVGGALGSTDNALLRADGTGGATAQGSSVIVDDNGNISGIASIKAGGNISSGEASRTFNLIDTQAAMRVWRWVALNGANPTVELIQGTAAMAADSANTWWDIFTSTVGGVSSADQLNIRRRTGGALTNLFTVLGTGELQMSGNNVFSAARHLQLRSYTVSTLPSAATAGQMIYVSNETGGATPAFSDGTNWRRVADRTIVS